MFYAEQSKMMISSDSNVSIEDFKMFYKAEKKHQKNCLRRHPG